MFYVKNNEGEYHGFDSAKEAVASYASVVKDAQGHYTDCDIGVFVSKDNATSSEVEQTTDGKGWYAMSCVNEHNGCSSDLIMEDPQEVFYENVLQWTPLKTLDDAGTALMTELDKAGLHEEGCGWKDKLAGYIAEDLINYEVNHNLTDILEINHPNWSSSQDVATLDDCTRVIEGSASIESIEGINEHLNYADIARLYVSSILSITEVIAKNTNELSMPPVKDMEWTADEKSSMNRDYVRFIQKTGEAAVKLGLDMNGTAQAKALKYMDGYDWKFIEENLPGYSTSRKMQMLQKDLSSITNATDIISITSDAFEDAIAAVQKNGGYVTTDILSFKEYLGDIRDSLPPMKSHKQEQEKAVTKEQEEGVEFSRDQQNKIEAVTNLAIKVCEAENNIWHYVPDCNDAAVFQPVIDIAERVVLNEGYASYLPYIDVTANKVLAITKPTDEAKAHLTNTLVEQAKERAQMAKTNKTHTSSATTVMAIQLCKEIANAHDDNTFAINELPNSSVYNIMSPIFIQAAISTGQLDKNTPSQPEKILNERKQYLEDRDTPKPLYDYLTETYPHQKWDKNTVELVEYWAKESGGLDMDTKKQLDELHPAEIAEVAENMIKKEMDGLELEEEGQESYRGYTLEELNKRLETIQKFAEDNIVIKMDKWPEQEKSTPQVDTTQNTAEEKIPDSTLYNYLTKRYPTEKWDKKAVNIIEYWAKQDGEYDMSTYDALDKLHPSALIAAASEALSLQRDGLNGENEKSFMGYTLKELNERTKIVEKFAEDHAVIPEPTIPKQEDNAHIYTSFLTALKNEQNKPANKGIAINDVAKKVMPRFPLTERVRIGKVLTDRGVRNKATLAQILAKDVGRMGKKREREEERGR